MTYDHWAAASARLRQSLLIPLTEGVKIEAVGHRTVIRMGSSGNLVETNPNLRLIQECLDWVQQKTVSE